MGKVIYMPEDKGKATFGDSFGGFMSSFGPLMQSLLMQKYGESVKDAQQLKDWQKLEKAGYATQQYSGTGMNPQQQNQSFAGAGIDPMNPQSMADYQTKQGLGTAPSLNTTIPEKFKNYRLNEANIPIGMDIKLPGDMGTYKSPQKGMTSIPDGFEIAGYDKSGLPIVKSNKGTKQKELLSATRLRQEFINRPEVKEYVTTKTQVKGMEEILKNSVGKTGRNNVATDQALITMYNKMTDPNSVVRESEYARTPQNLPLFHRIEGMMQKVSQGGAGLTDDDRKAIVQGAKILQKARGATYNDTYKGYADLSSEYDLNQNLVTRGMTEYEDIPEEQPQDIQFEIDTINQRLMELGG